MATPIGALAVTAAWTAPSATLTTKLTCLCGTPLRAHANHWDCSHCGRSFCRECGGPIARSGGCDVCTVCGSGSCG